MPDDLQDGEGQPFADDVDTVPQCTGECCDPVRVLAEDYWDMSRDPNAYRNSRYLMNMLVPAQRPIPQHGTVEFSCRYFDRETRRCVAYDRRPAMCREYPETGTCRFCGGRFATGAHPEKEELGHEEALERVRLAAMRSLISTSASEAAGPSTPRRLRRKSG
jgi:Fe-S-cluster containining protein